jgi:hypothetical protein
MEDKSILIPRNLNQNDSVKIGLGINLEFSNMPLIFGGAILAYLISDHVDDIILKTLTCSTLVGGAYLIGKIKCHGQDLPELCLNRILYGKRKRYYEQKRGTRK